MNAVPPRPATTPPAPPGSPPAPRPPRRGARFWNAGAFGLLILAFLVVLLWNRIVITVPAGHVGVLWLRFFGGTVTQFYYGEGTKLIPPWDRLFIYSVRLQRLEEKITALSIDGLPVTIDVNAMFVLNPQLAGNLHAEVGPDYVTKWLSPLLSSAVRERIAGIRAEHMYTIASLSIEDAIRGSLQQKIIEMVDVSDPRSNAVRILQLSIRSVTLPPTVQSAIENRLSAEQALQRYRLSVDQEKLEAERRAIEAEGIRRFQEIVNPSISDSFLRWRGIEATVALSQSPNAKIVVIGGANGLPLILDGRGDTNIPNGAAAPAGTPPDPASPPDPAAAPGAPEGAPPGTAAPRPAGTMLRELQHIPPLTVRPSSLGLPSLALPPTQAVGTGLSSGQQR